LPSLRRLIVVGEEAQPTATLFSELAELAELAKEVTEADRNRIWSAAQPNDIACILYTYGSTARPKGVPLEH
jgi:long-subunit acyl-CoA synthetase (AMP-forming)